MRERADASAARLDVQKTRETRFEARRQMEDRLMRALRLSRRPVAITLLPSAPDGVAPVHGSVPAGCSFWRMAAEGRTFWTSPSDHRHCALGAFTHGLARLAGRDVDEEIPSSLLLCAGHLPPRSAAIPRAPSEPGGVLYAPLGMSPVSPDVVVVSGRYGDIALLREAALRVGVPVHEGDLDGTPCIALARCLIAREVCIMTSTANRIYAGLDRDEVSAIFPGRDVDGLADAATSSRSAHERLAAHHRTRLERHGPAE